MNFSFYIARMSANSDQIVFLKNDEVMRRFGDALAKGVSYVSTPPRGEVESRLRAGWRLYTEYSEWERVVLSVPAEWIPRAELNR